VQEQMIDRRLTEFMFERLRLGYLSLSSSFFVCPQCGGFNGVIDMNGTDNMMLLPNDFHRKNHDKSSKYSQTVRYHLRDRWNALIAATQKMILTKFAMLSSR